MCAESNIYGAALCVESELRREYYHEEYPLYYFLGYTHMALKIVPGKQPSELHPHCYCACHTFPYGLEHVSNIQQFRHTTA